MITLEDNELTIAFPGIRTTPRQLRGSPRGSRGQLFERPMRDAPPPTLQISFQRTLRVPCDAREYPLPPSLGAFPLRHVDDYPRTAPRSWLDRGGVLIPMYQAEAMWIDFHCERWGFAVQIAAGKVNALTGLSWSDELQAKPQSYCVVPTQPWLDGFKVSTDTVRQFVAAPLGEGHTVEEQVAGTDDVGGLQLSVSPMIAKAYWDSDLPMQQGEEANGAAVCYLRMEEPESLGLAAGGLIRQEVAEDEYGLTAWGQSARLRSFVHIVNSAQWRRITGESPPHRPVGIKEYNEAGLPWFEYYDELSVPVPGSAKLMAAKPYGDSLV